MHRAFGSRRHPTPGFNIWQSGSLGEGPNRDTLKSRSNFDLPHVAVENDDTVFLNLMSANGNVRIIEDTDRRFPAIAIQGDTLNNLYVYLTDEDPEFRREGIDVLRSWLSLYERVLGENGIDIPYG